MASQRSTLNIGSPEVERRRNQRFLLIVPLEVMWQVKERARVKRRAETEVVNAHGGLL